MKYLFFLFIFAVSTAFSQAPMVMFSPYDIREYNYINFQTKYDDWMFKKSDTEFIMAVEVKEYEGFAYYFFNDSLNRNYKYTIKTANFLNYVQLKYETLKYVIYYKHGWYVQPDNNLYIYFLFEDVDKIPKYSIIYSDKPYDVLKE